MGWRDLHSPCDLASLLSMRTPGGSPAAERVSKPRALVAGAFLLATLLPWTTSAESARAPHPEPRVIVTVTQIRGGHEASAVQRAAREISATGQVVGTRRLFSSFSDELTHCLRDGLHGKAMPKAHSGSSATIEIQLAPGDE
jgi:hypothetical protein